MGQWIRRPGVEGDVKFSGRLGRGRVGNEWKIHLMNVRNDFGVGGSFQRFAVDLEDLVADLQIRFVRRRSCAIKQSVVTTFVSICGPFRPISANRIANDVSVFDAGVAAIRLAHKVLGRYVKWHANALLKESQTTFDKRRLRAGAWPASQIFSGADKNVVDASLKRAPATASSGPLRPASTQSAGQIQRGPSRNKRRPMKNVRMTIRRGHGNGRRRGKWSAYRSRSSGRFCGRHFSASSFLDAGRCASIDSVRNCRPPLADWPPSICRRQNMTATRLWQPAAAAGIDYRSFGAFFFCCQSPSGRRGVRPNGTAAAHRPVDDPALPLLRPSPASTFFAIHWPWGEVAAANR